MKMVTRASLFAGLLVICARGLSGADAQATATAKFLAGLPLTDTPLASYSANPAWQKHSLEFERAWTQVERVQLAHIREWAPAFLGDAYASNAPLFYMFSGPDFLYANAFFPHAGSYVFCGAEPVGAIPDVSKVPPELLDAALTNLRKSLESSLNWSFFITKNMKVDLEQPQLSGTLPILYLFLARAGYNIDSVDFVSIDKSGALVAPNQTKLKGVKLVFSGRGGPPQTLYYFVCDLADDYMKANPWLLKFCQEQGRGAGFLKAASYLMHRSDFSSVRDFLLSHTSVILQDDSGIPFHFFENGQWDLRFAGRYYGPIDTFKEWPQPDLAKAYAENPRAALDFGFGYQWQARRSSLMLAMRKSVARIEPDGPSL